MSEEQMIPEVVIPRGQLDDQGKISLPRLIVALGLERSTSNARRVIEGGGVTIGPERESVTDASRLIGLGSGEDVIVRVGKNGRKAAKAVVAAIREG